MKTKQEWIKFLDDNDQTWDWAYSDNSLMPINGIAITSAEGLGYDYIPVVLFNEEDEFTGFSVVA